MTEVLLRPLADAFMQVGVFVALLVAPFGWAQHRWGDQLAAALTRHARHAPAAAALLTMPPGCGGAIIVMSLYARGAVGFGAAVAALVATMGDASWVLLAADPVLTLKLKALLLLTGATTGYVVDALGITPRRRVDAQSLGASSPSAGLVGVGGRVVVPAPPPSLAPAVDQYVGSADPARVGPTCTTLWVVLGVGALVAVPVSFQLAPAGTAYLALGVLGTLAAVVALVQGRGRATVAAPPTSLRAVARDGGHEVALITTWVALAYLSWSLLNHLTGFDGSQLPLLGVTGVAVGALVGLVPGCAVQIVFTGIFLAGGMPLPTLVANTISQDGDALLPLLVLEHRSALLASLITTMPALLVGGVLLLLG
ncbi:putative manganese transporter [Nocardioides dongxiaopingii]|uniref:putative manganese transporter n=1 Tax=Nocardioides dongxiaopingii TaxID=2576036 RepID=UPI0010C765BF|nr:putative manganese transporter [Nocardioides dongxiaopingii]